MVRISAIFSVILFSLLSFLSAPVERQVGLILIGGDYTIQADEIRRGDVVVLLASITLEDGGIIEGSLRTFGGSVSVGGRVTENIQSISSDLNIHPTAQISGKLNQLGKLPFQQHLPSVLLVIS